MRQILSSEWLGHSLKNIYGGMNCLCSLCCVGRVSNNLSTSFSRSTLKFVISLSASVQFTESGAGGSGSFTNQLFYSVSQETAYG